MVPLVKTILQKTNDSAASSKRRRGFHITYSFIGYIQNSCAPEQLNSWVLHIYNHIYINDIRINRLHSFLKMMHFSGGGYLYIHIICIIYICIIWYLICICIYPYSSKYLLRLVNLELAFGVCLNTLELRVFGALGHT